MEYKVSIIVPVYNVERYLRDCMETLVNQTLDNLEIIVVNDGSPDNSLDILNEYERLYPDCVKVFTTENKGVSHARNYGLDRANGEYILFVDSDDFIELDMCEKLYNKAENDNNDLVICSRYNVYENEKTGKLTKKAIRTGIISQNFNVVNTNFEYAHISPFPWDKLFKKSYIGDARFPEDMRFEDLVFSYELLCTAKNIGVVEEPLYNYRRTTQGGFLNTFSEATFDIVRAFDIVVEYLKKNNYFEILKEEIEYVCVRHFLFRYPVFFKMENRGNIELKIRIIDRTQDFLDMQFPNWRNNHYVLYTASPVITSQLKLYTNRKKLIKTVKKLESTPQKMLEMQKKLESLSENTQQEFTKFKKSKKKINIIRNKFKVLKLFSLPVAYRYSKQYEVCKVEEKTVLLESKHGADIAGNIFSILQELNTEIYEGFLVYLVIEEDNREKFEKLLHQYEINNVKFVVNKTKEYLRLLASAKFLITDTSFPPYFVKKPDQVYLNTWHGTPLKAMGKRVSKREYGLGNVQRNFLIADYLLYQNEFSKDIFLKDYMIDKLYKGEVLLSGYPRNTAFFNTSRYEEIRSECSLIGKQVLVYMPTWRGLLHKMENKKQVKEIYEYFLKIDEKLTDSQVMFVKLHPFVKSGINYDDFIHICPFPEEYETYDFLNASDALITDYSSIMFDYAVSKKKIVLFTYDREEYLTGRGMYLDLNEVDLPRADTVDELIKEINKEDMEYPKFYKEYCLLDNKDCTKKVCEKVFLNENVSDLITEKYSNEKSKVLIYLHRVPRGERLNELIKSINSIDTSEFDYFVSFNAGSLKKRSEVLSEIKEDIGYLPIQPGRNATLSEKMATILMLKFGIKNNWTKAKLKKLMLREKRKHYGEVEFTFLLTHQTWTDWMKMRMM